MEMNTSTITVSQFDYSVQNHFNAMNTIRKLCSIQDEEEEEAIDPKDIQSINSRITFLREWESYKYEPRTIRFTSETEGQQGKNVIGQANLPLFSSVNVPKMEKLSSETNFTETSNDFVLYVGGHVWGLDWCPSVHQNSDCHVTCEYLAVAAHPPESSYHKIGTPLTGTGVIQIWCVLHTAREESPPILRIHKGKTRKQFAEEQVQKGKTKKQFAKEKDNPPFKRPRGRPRKEPLHISEGENQVYQPRVRPKREKHKRKYLAESDIESDSVSVVDVDISPTSSQFLASTDASMSIGYPQLENCDVDGSDRDNQAIDATAVLSCNVVEKRARGRPKKQKRARGRPKKLKDIKEPVVVLTSENETTKSTEERVLLKNFDADVDLDDSNRENQMAETLPVLSCDVKEKQPHLPNRARGRSKKLKEIKETVVVLNSENKFVPPLAVGTSKFLASTDASMSTEYPQLENCDVNISDRENQMIDATAVVSCNGMEKRARGRPKKQKRARGRPKKQDNIKEPVVVLTSENEATRSKEECLLLKNFDADVGLDDSIRKNQMAEASPVLSCDVKEKQPQLPNSTRGRSKEHKEIKETVAVLNSENKLVPLLAVDISSGFLASNKATQSTEELALLKNFEADVGSDDPNRENQMSEERTVFSCNVKARQPHLLKRARGRPRKKNCVQVPSVDLNTTSEPIQAPAVDTPQASCGDLALTEAAKSNEEGALMKSCDTDDSFEAKPLAQWCNENTTVNRVSIDEARKHKDETEAVSHNDGVSPVVLTQDEDTDSFLDVLQGSESYHQHGMILDSNEAKNGSLVVNTSGFDPPRDVTLPRVVFCLAHNGKVAWDVKWRPRIVSDVEHKHHLGYLAVLLGNGSIEVWEVPSPKAIETLYPSRMKEGTDPRFVKLEPVFRCSKLKSGDRHSIPLTVEWSTSFPHDLLLAGCHDGRVALWKFTASSVSAVADTKPLLCFRADTFPIRALAWAPGESEEDSANIIVTAGDGGVRFWDIRDPYRPLWCLKLVQRIAYSLDWLQDPSCVIMSFEDGTLRILSISRVTSESPVTGKLCAEIQGQGSHNHLCSSFPIWSVHASRLTGQLVCCSSDGSVLHFQITSKLVDKDKSRYKEPQFICGSLSEEDAILTVNTPMPNISFEMKKSPSESGDMFRSFRSHTSGPNQVKRGNDQAPDHDHDTLALCCNDDPSTSQFNYGDTLPVSKSIGTSMISKKRNPDPNSVQGDETTLAEKHEEAAGEIEKFPPKIVSMHRVRWNMNEGSERLVCYGGAAGIVRCQEILAYSPGWSPGHKPRGRPRKIPT